jgi:hypothetical protein
VHGENRPYKYIEIDIDIDMESGDIAPPFLILTLDRGEWSASCSGRFTPKEKFTVPSR